MENTNRLRKILTSKEFTLFVTLVAIVLLFGSITPNGAFLKPRNIRSILDSMTIYTLFAVGGALVIISGNIDLSPSYVGAACGVLLAKLLNDGVPWYLVVPICLLMGAAFGVLNAVLINEFKIQSFIATLTTGTFIAKGLVYLIPDGVTYQIKDPVVVWYSTGKIFGFVPITMIISIAIIVIFGIVLAKTRFGRSVYLIGGNANAARLAGLKPKKTFIYNIRLQRRPRRTGRYALRGTAEIGKPCRYRRLRISRRNGRYPRRCLARRRDRQYAGVLFRSSDNKRLQQRLTGHGRKALLAGRGIRRPSSGRPDDRLLLDPGTQDQDDAEQ